MAQRTTSRRRERRQDLVEDALEEIAELGERVSALGFGRPREDDAETSRSRQPEDVRARLAV